MSTSCVDVLLSSASALLSEWLGCMALLMVAKSGEEWDALWTSEDQPRAAAFEEGLVVLLNDQGWANLAQNIEAIELKAALQCM